MTDVKIVTGLNYGDESKGLVANAVSTPTCLNILPSNSCQRAHTVVENGVRKVFRHFGSGTLKGAATYFTDKFLVNPVMFRQEWEELAAMGITPKVYVRLGAVCVTPIDMFANVNVEERRGEESHSSTGCGVWETICRHKALAPKFPQGKGVYVFEDIVAYYEEVLKDEKGVLPENVKEFLHGDCLKDNIDEDFIWFYEHVTIIKDQWEETQLLHSYPLLVFENGQGLLLDDRYSRDINHNTPAYVGMVEAERILNQNFLRTEVNVEALYVTRSYYTRHGKGQIGLWSNCECDKDDINPRMFDATNVPNPNQGTLRYGKIDELEAKAIAARAVNDSISPFFDVTTSMVVTHCNEYMNDYLIDAANDQNLNLYVSYDETNIRKV